MVLDVSHAVSIRNRCCWEAKATMTMNGHHTVNIANSNRHPNDDDHHALPPSSDHDDDEQELVDPDDPFDITQTKNVSHDTLRRWRVIILSLCIFSSILLLFIIQSASLSSTLFHSDRAHSFSTWINHCTFSLCLIYTYMVACLLEMYKCFPVHLLAVQCTSLNVAEEN